MRYHIYKATRVYEGRPYEGASSGGQPAQADTIAQAQTMREQMLLLNPVGWRIHDTATGQDILVD